MKPDIKTTATKKLETRSVSALSTMLVLQQNTAWWLKVSHDKIVDCQAVELDSATGTPAAELSIPRWRHDQLQSDVFYVDLVLDTTIDEVDRVGVPSSGSKIINHYWQFKTLRRLRNDFPHACVYPLSSPTDERAALMHPVVPDAWNEWLLRVQTCGVVMQSVVTSTQLGCHWSKRFSAHVLLSMPSSMRTRHVLIQRGAAIFLRTMKVLSPECSDSQSDAGVMHTDLTELNQTIDYIQSNTSLAMQPILIIELVSAHANSLVENTASENLQICSDSTLQNMTQTLSPSIYCLFAMFHDQQLHYRSRLEMPATQLGAHSEKVGASKMFTEGNAQPSAHKFVAPAMLSSLFKALTKWTTAWRSKNRWLLITPTLRWAPYLQSSIEHMNVLRRQRYLSRLSVVMVCSVVIAASAILINGVMGYRTIERNDLERNGKSEAIEKPMYSAEGLRVPLSFTADSLFVKDELSRDSQLSTDFLLTSIARVVSAAPNITIERLVWTSLEDNELFETLTLGSMAVVSRASVVQADARKSVQMQIEGGVSVAALAKQKSALDSFVKELKSLPWIREVRVLESPLDSALSSGTQGHEAGKYQLSLLLGGVQ